jgi:hypothetical protein
VNPERKMVLYDYASADTGDEAGSDLPFDGE